MSICSKLSFAALLVLVGGALSGPTAWALSYPQNLPQGVRAAALVYGFSGTVENRFSDAGELQSLVAPLQRSLTLRDLEPAVPEIAQLRGILNPLGHQNLADSLIVMQLDADIQVRESQRVVGLLWGVHHRFTVGAYVPWIERKVNPIFRVTHQKQVQPLLSALGNVVPEISNGLRELDQADLSTAAFEKAIFDNHGLKRPAEFSAQGWGDLITEIRYALDADGEFIQGLRLQVRAPTAQYQPDLTNLFDQPLDEKNWALKVGYLQAYEIQSWIFSGSVFGTWRAPKNLRILATTPEESIPNALDASRFEDVYYQAGAQIDVELGAFYNTFGGVWVHSIAYQHRRKWADNYQGVKGLDYASLAQHSQGWSHGLEFTSEITTVPLFLAERFAAPLKFFVTWYQPLEGRNLVYAPFGTVNTVFLF